VQDTVGWTSTGGAVCSRKGHKQVSLTRGEKMEKEVKDQTKTSKEPILGRKWGNTSSEEIVRGSDLIRAGGRDYTRLLEKG